MEGDLYGLTTNIESDNIVWVAVHEYVSIARDLKRSDTWRDRLRYLLCYSRQVGAMMARTSVPKRCVANWVSQAFCSARRGAKTCSL